MQSNETTDERSYNLPTADEISVILPGDGSQKYDFRDIILHCKGKVGFKRISECHPAYLPLHYVLMFPYNEMSWHPNIKQLDLYIGKHTAKRLAFKKIHNFRLFESPSEYSTILRANKLFHEYLVDALASTEQNHIFYMKKSRDKLRADSYKHTEDSAESGLSPKDLGKPYVLSSSLIGVHRHMYEIYEDSMAIIRFNHHPDIFLTMTTNLRWPEIQDALAPHQYPWDRTDCIGVYSSYIELS
ncbi:uncharacterized protein LOC113360417 [Papaver somniferum]|uniref:uncharacterized protein LOC113360417 n=1 Tax=Papaver somniferum TaxID=3469 RepID=UPI000E6FE71C|nr:uncharacterized protein LOC113360417 [Papaver somniferum]